MNECLLCKKDMPKNKSNFGKACINNVFKFLNIKNYKKIKNKEDYLYKFIVKKTNSTSLNSEQKIWLIDRFLTYEYLDKIPYGNADNEKKELETDLKNINKINSLQDTKTNDKIKLKNVYNLYKNSTKFNTNIIDFKNNKFNTSSKIKLFFANCSFIFNLKKNKSQYEKSTLKAMQFVFWQTVIEVGGKYFNYKLAADLLQHSLNTVSTDYIINAPYIIEKVKNDKNLKSKITELISKNTDKNNIFIPFGEEYVTFENSDLYFAIHHANIELSAHKNADLSYGVNISLSDIFDFTKFKTPFEYYFDTNNIPKSILSSTLYNFAFVSQKENIIKEYKVILNFSITTDQLGNII